MSGKSLCTLCLLVCAYLGDNASAAADSGEAYHRTVEEALQEFNLGNWDEAALLFERAHALNPSARTERGMGMAAFEARHYVVAITHLRAALDDQRNPLTSVQREEVQRALDRAEDYVARVTIELQPTAARVRINGHDVQPDAQGDRLADPGLQEIEVAADGFEPQLRRVNVAPGKRATLEIKLQPLAAPAPSLQLAASPEQDTSTLSAWKWALGAAGVAGLAAGGAFLIMQKVEADRFNGMCDRNMLSDSCAALERSAGQTWYVGSIVGLGLGAGLLSASAIMFALDGSKPSSEHTNASGCRLGFADFGVTCKLTL